jgi:hypothetical protein
VRLLYVDDAGIGKEADEPIAVVAGVAVHADKQLKALEQYLASLVEKHIDHEDRPGFVFHAKEMFHAGKTLTREKYDKGRRWAMLDDLVQIPSDFDFPVSFGFLARRLITEALSQEMNASRVVIAHGIAATHCAVGFERWLEHIDSDEVGLLVSEDNQQARKIIKQSHAAYKNPQLVSMMQPILGLPLTRIVDTVHFAQKDECAALQVADACAFAIKRFLMKKPEADRFYRPLVPQLIWQAKPDDELSVLEASLESGGAKSSLPPDDNSALS